MYTGQCIADDIIANGGSVGRRMQRPPRPTPTPWQPACEECKITNWQHVWQHQHFTLSCEEGAAPEQAKGIAACSGNGAKLEAPALPAHSARSPGYALAAPHRCYIASSMPWQGRAVGNLYP